MTRLLGHLPSIYNGIRDFRELSKTVSLEYDGIEQSLQRIDDDQFVLTSSEHAIARRERDFGIVPDRTIENLMFRKRRLLLRMQENAIYTDKYLKELLDALLGEGMSQVKIDRLKLELEVLVEIEGVPYYNEVKQLLERIVPLNVDIATAALLLQEFYLMTVKDYTFPVPYKTTGTFHTTPTNGVASKSALSAKPKTYANPVPYPITGTFYCSEGGY